MEQRFITGQRVYVYSFKLNLNKINKDMYGYVEYAEDVSDTDWLGDIEYNYQNLSIVLDNGKEIYIRQNRYLKRYSAIPVQELNKMLGVS
ncbi:hypothetical protein [Niallia taxi]|uniref:hypothetical protein n=1 Tax=Niallia taxi TaxID=2499688 RepID=UPI00300A67B6